MQAQLHNYQKKAIEFIMRKKCCALWLGMGLGKTLTTLTAIKELIDNRLVKKILIIAPLRVANNVWSTEMDKWSHTKNLRYSIATGSPKQRLRSLSEDLNIYIINRENTSWLLDAGYKDTFDMIVIDESSSFKNPQAKRFKSLKKFSYEYMVQLTGTPSPKSLLDLWSQIYLLDKGARLGKTFCTYKDNMFNSDFMGYNFTPKDVQAIYKAVADIALSMKADDYIELPRQVFINIEVDITSLKEYKKLEKDFILKYKEETYAAVNAAVLVGKLLQLANGFLYGPEGEYEVLHDSKIDALKELVELNPDERLIVVYNFKSDLERLLINFPQAVVLDNNQQTIVNWNKGGVQMLLCHPASSSMGLNLQAGGSNIVWFGLTWNLEYYTQMNARVHRQGQTKPVVINHIVAKGTVDESVLKSLSKKGMSQDELFSSVLCHRHH